MSYLHNCSITVTAAHGMNSVSVGQPVSELKQSLRHATRRARQVLHNKEPAEAGVFRMQSEGAPRKTETTGRNQRRSAPPSRRPASFRVAPDDVDSTVHQWAQSILASPARPLDIGKRILRQGGIQFCHCWKCFSQSRRPGCRKRLLSLMNLKAANSNFHARRNSVPQAAPPHFHKRWRRWGVALNYTLTIYE